jgi:hypothetical protein
MNIIVQIMNKQKKENNDNFEIFRKISKKPHLYPKGVV